MCALKLIMNYCKLFVLISVPILLVNLYAIVFSLSSLVNITSFLIYIPLMLGFCKRLDLKNYNILAFFSLSAISSVLFFYPDQINFWLSAIFFNMLSYIFLGMEALKYTKVKIGSTYMLTFFFVLIGVNAYFVLEHLHELESHLGGTLEFTVYTIYYLCLFALSLVALIYYMNSYSRKSVYFISLVMALVVSDILRDMALFYLPDASVMVLIAFLHFAAIFLAFQFFITKEKKLRLMNLL